MLVGGKCRDVDHARADSRRRQGHRLGSRGLYGVEFLPAALEQDADQIDHHVGVARGRLDRGRVDGRLAAGGGGEDELGLSVEDVEGVGELGL